MGVPVTMGVPLTLAVLVTVAVCVSMIGTALWLKGRCDICDVGVETLQHVDDHVVLLDPNAVDMDFRWQVPVSDMPGENGESARGACPDFDQGFRLGFDLDRPAILEHKAITIAKLARFRQINEHALACVEGQHFPAKVTLATVEQNVG